MSISSIIFSFGGFVAVIVCQPNNDGLSGWGGGAIVKLSNVGSGCCCCGGGGGGMRLLNNGSSGSGGGGTALLNDGDSGGGGGC